MASLNEITTWWPVAIAIVTAPFIGAFIGWIIHKELY